MNSLWIVVLVVLALPPLLYVGARGWLLMLSRGLRTPVDFDELHTVTTADGARVVVGRLGPPKTSPSPLPPVVMCHGLAMNRRSFALDPQRSLARHLASQGRDVWLLELRHVSSTARKGLKAEGTFDDHVRQDVPAALAFVCEKTGVASVDWVGFSMGGMLAYSHLGARRGTRVRRLVTIGSPVRFTGHWISRWLLMFPRLHRLTLTLDLTPNRAILLALAPWLWPWLPHALTPGFRPRQYDRKGLQAAFANVFGDSPSGVQRQFARWIREGSFNSDDGVDDYFAGIASIRAPTLVIAGSDDRLAPPEAVRAAFDQLRCDERAHHEVGTATGARDEYDHLDLILGQDAPKDVFPKVTEWLSAPVTSP